MALTLKKAFLKTLFWILSYNFSYHFVKPLIGFIAFLTPSKVKFIYTEFYQYGCVFKKKAHEGRLRLF